jgi:hypothetical protein
MRIRVEIAKDSGIDVFVGASCEKETGAIIPS